MKRIFMLLAALLISLVFATIVYAATDIPALGAFSPPQVIVFPSGNEWVVRIIPEQLSPSFRVVQTSEGIFIAMPMTVGGCGPAQRQDIQIGDWNVTGPAVLNGWTNLPSQDQSMWKVLIPHGQTFRFTQTGGSLWRFPAGCSSDEVQGNFDRNPLPPQSWDELHRRGITL